MPEIYAFVPLLIIPFGVFVTIWAWAIVSLIFLFIYLLIRWLLLIILQISHWAAIIIMAVMVGTYLNSLIQKNNKSFEEIASTFIYSWYGKVMSVLFFIDLLVLLIWFDFDYMAKLNFIWNYW
tara:strand:+ start:148 stop:516 length:369 start_codon:yes stop_codon:yes gene_type:complete